VKEFTRVTTMKRYINGSQSSYSIQNFDFWTYEEVVKFKV